MGEKIKIKDHETNILRYKFTDKIQEQNIKLLDALNQLTLVEYTKEASIWQAAETI